MRKGVRIVSTIYMPFCADSKKRERDIRKWTFLCHKVRHEGKLLCCCACAAHRGKEMRVAFAGLIFFFDLPFASLISSAFLLLYLHISGTVAEFEDRTTSR